jgi:hypothetical protein
MRKVFLVSLVLVLAVGFLSTALAGGPDNPTREKSETSPAMEFAACGFLIQGQDCMYFEPAGDSIKLVLDNYGDFQEYDSVYVEGHLNIYCETDCMDADGCLEGNTITECGFGVGVPFSGNGILFESGGCLLFEPMSDSVSFELSNYGEFQAGECVFVAGTIFPDYEFECVDADFYLVNFYITPGNCDTPPFPYQCCGTLVQGTECVLFAPWCEIAIMTPNGLAEYFVLDNYGGFQIGDSVMVAGLVDIGCETDCPDGDACIINNTIDTCYSGNPVDTIAGCGVLMQSGECVLFALENTTLKFTLGNYGVFQPGDSAYVAGYVYWGEDSVCVESDGYINNWLIEPCGNPLDTITLYGVLVQGSNCVLFDPATYSIYDKFALDYYGSFQVGDSVRVSGILDPDCNTVCIDADACILYNSIRSWGGDPGIPFESCGLLVQAVNCLLFQPEGFSDTGFVLENYGDYQEGDTVYVNGLLNTGCETDCIGAMGCIWDNTIAPCDNPNPPDTVTLYGVLVQGTDCVLFDPPTFSFYDKFALDNYGNFQVGDSVLVTGFLDPDCITDCSDADACILDNTIEAWGGGDPGVPFQSCGTLVQIEYCLLFAPDGFGDTMFVLENYGDFEAGDSVYVDGFLTTNCGTICMGAMGCIWENTIAPCETPLDTVYLCGMLVQGTECVLFEPFYTFVYTLIALDNYSSFQVGDSVIVIGLLDPDCMTICIDADACILDNTIEAWSNPGTYYEGIGYLYGVGECILFVPFGSYYEEYVLENYGDFGPYDTVFVTGTMYFGCDDPCITDTGGCILDNTIEWAGYPDSSMAPYNSAITDVTNYPNPFNPTATISFNLTAPARVTLTIYNILGQQVETLIDNKLLDGPQIAKWNGDKFASGIYFYRIKTDYEVITKKMSLSK